MPINFSPILRFPDEQDLKWQTGDGRTWIKIAPREDYGLLACAFIGAASLAGPDISPIWCADPQRRRAFLQVDKTVGAPTRGEVPVTMQMSKRNFLSWLQRQACVFTMDARYGECGNADDPSNWEHVVRFCDAMITNIATTDMTAREPDQAGGVDVTATVSWKEWYDIYPLATELSPISLLTAIRSVFFCDYRHCGECGEEWSEGCNILYATTEVVAGNAYLLASDDGGDTWMAYAITPFVTDDAGDGACVGGDVVVITEDTPAMAWADRTDLTTWTQVVAGFLPGCQPRGMYSIGSRETFICAANGTIYHTENPRNGVTVMENASLTNNNLNEIVAVSSQRIYVVGDNNVFLYSVDGGETWNAGTGPSAGNDLIALAAQHIDGAQILMVGTSNGELWQSFDAGATWTQRALPVAAGTYNLPAIAICGCEANEMFCILETGTYLAPSAGCLFRSINMGLTWREITLPTNLGVEDVACCSPNHAVVVGSTLADGTGFIAVAHGS